MRTRWVGSWGVALGLWLAPARAGDLPDVRPAVPPPPGSAQVAGPAGVPGVIPVPPPLPAPVHEPAGPPAEAAPAATPALSGDPQPWLAATGWVAVTGCPLWPGSGWLGLGRWRDAGADGACPRP